MISPPVFAINVHIAKAAYFHHLSKRALLLPAFAGPTLTAEKRMVAPMARQSHSALNGTFPISGFLKNSAMRADQEEQHASNAGKDCFQAGHVSAL